MKTTYLPQCSIIANAKPTRSIPYGKITAGLAVVAWLALAGQAISQSTNQWAPAQATPAPTAAAHVWADGEGAAIYAPSDLDQQLSTGSARLAPQAQNPEFGQAAPVYAPAYAALQPGAQRPTRPAQAVQTQAALPAYNPQGYGPVYANMPYGNGPNGMPPFVPFNGGYANGSYANGPYNNGPYSSGPNNWGNNWGGPSTNNSFQGLPFFGGSPFSFW